MLRLPPKSAPKSAPLPARTLAFDPKKFREKWLADLTAAIEKHMRSDAFLEWLRIALVTTTHAQVLSRPKSMLHTIANIHGPVGGTSHAK